MSNIIKSDDGCFIEKDCLFKGVSSGGAFIGLNTKTGLKGGVMYAYPKENKIGSWDGKLKIKAVYTSEWMSNMGDMRQMVYFNYKGKSFYGVYYKTGGSIVRVKEKVVK